MTGKYRHQAQAALRSVQRAGAQFTFTRPVSAETPGTRLDPLTDVPLEDDLAPRTYQAWAIVLPADLPREATPLERHRSRKLLIPALGTGPVPVPGDTVPIEDATFTLQNVIPLNPTGDDPVMYTCLATL